MREPEWDIDDLAVAQPVPVRRSALQLVIGLGVMTLVVFGILGGGVALVSGYLPPSDNTAPYCNPITDHCTNAFNLAGIQTQTGYTFPPGSVLLDSSTRGGSLRYPQERSLTATVQMPAGAVLPTTDDPLSSISSEGTDAEGHVLIQVTTSNGKGRTSVDGNGLAKPNRADWIVRVSRSAIGT